MLTYTLWIEKKFTSNLVNIWKLKKRLFSKSQLNHRFGKAYELEGGVFVLHRKFRVNQKSSRKHQPIKTSLSKNMKRITEVNYDLLSDPGNILFSQRENFFFYPITPSLEKIFQKYKTHLTHIIPFFNLIRPKIYIHPKNLLMTLKRILTQRTYRIQI